MQRPDETRGNQQPGEAENQMENQLSPSAASQRLDRTIK
jgi:hypothetical protein